MEIADTDSYDDRQGLKAAGPVNGELDLVDFLTSTGCFLMAT